ncbi:MULTISPECIES: dihydrolipoamide acetyltransferase family protein [unclassified Microbacterium]|uniref:dihydrolipoamide acetyltransferase family protein n=1 Tax=unclassified Microbacterium TaxID=2609290 RepID=UPI0012F90E88|nr:dihydrolipoamide acetyltransferase family protein [Microbacterium sp. MAH-37]MVQ42057.1 2-oxo acid dehydrogenase subunit E2 [Microbacterium sp. MAH-37]
MSVATARVFRLPDLGEGLTEAGLVQWLVAVGDTVTVDQPIAEVETAKSVVELPTPFAGVVTALHGAEGETIAVGAPVLEVADAAAPAAPSDHATSGPERAERDEGRPDSALLEAHRQEEQAGSGNVLIGYGTPERASSGRRRRPRRHSTSWMPSETTDQTDTGRRAAPEHAVPTPDGPSNPTPPNTRIRPNPTSETTDQTGTARRATAGHAGSAQDRPSNPTRSVAVRNPIVRRLARDLGLDVHTITPTGVDGAVTRADVLRAAVDHAVVHAAAAHAASSSPASASADPSGLAIRSQEPLSPLRRAASATLSRSRAEIPEATVWVDVDATELWNARKAMAPEGGRAPSMTALLARFTLLALEDFPILASRLSPDATELTVFDGVSLGIAADTPRGLVVPVIPRAHAMDLDTLDTAIRDAADAARAGTLAPERMRGSTFTLNNYGTLGVDGSAAIINPPNVAIFGIGRIIERPWVVDGQIVPRRVAQLSLVFDHRVCDGGYASGFLRRVTDLIEHPLRAFGRL